MTKNLLIIGGTVFLGRHLVRIAGERGHKVTTFNRGNHILAEQDEIERIIGDRNTDLGLLSGRRFDAVIDCCGMEAEQVAKSAEALKDSCSSYVFISSISAFENFKNAGMTETAKRKLTPKGEEQDYGSEKAWSENVVDEHFKDRALIIRPGLIVGPYDPTDRFTYWVHRVAKGGLVLAPGRPERPIQFIDVKDLAGWIIRLVEAEIAACFNASGPGYELSMAYFLNTVKEVCCSQPEFEFVDDEKLLACGLKPWTEMPLWIPEKEEDYFGFMRIDCNRAQNAGLSYRTLYETIEDVLAWDNSRNYEKEPAKAGLSPEKESELLATLVAPR